MLALLLERARHPRDLPSEWYADDAKQMVPAMQFDADTGRRDSSSGAGRLTDRRALDGEGCWGGRGRRAGGQAGSVRVFVRLATLRL